MLLFVTQENMAKKAGEIAPFEILARIHFNLQVAVCPAKIWSVLCTYHNYINPNTTFLKKMGLTKQRMVECDALFFYQLLLPIADPAMSGIKDDPMMGYYKDVSVNTNMFAFGPKNR